MRADRVGRRPGFLDTLAAACAECGEFDDAVKWQEKALGLAGPGQEADYDGRLELYRQRKPARATVPGRRGAVRGGRIIPA